MFGGNGLERFLGIARLERGRRKNRSFSASGAAFPQFRRCCGLLDRAAPKTAAGNGRTALIACRIGSGSPALTEAGSFPGAVANPVHPIPTPEPPDGAGGDVCLRFLSREASDWGGPLMGSGGNLPDMIVRLRGLTQKRPKRRIRHLSHHFHRQAHPRYPPPRQRSTSRLTLSIDLSARTGATN
jgi:hypothetical protein